MDADFLFVLDPSEFGKGPQPRSSNFDLPQTHRLAGCYSQFAICLCTIQLFQNSRRNPLTRRDMTPRIKSISASGIRTLDGFKLDLDGLTVLIGDNGSGKSTIVEVCELLRRLTSQNFWNEFNQIHGGEALSRRIRTGQLKMGVEALIDDATCNYQITLGGNEIQSEELILRQPGKNDRRIFTQKRRGKVRRPFSKGCLQDGTPHWPPDGVFERSTRKNRCAGSIYHNGLLAQPIPRWEAAGLFATR